MASFGNAYSVYESFKAGASLKTTTAQFLGVELSAANTALITSSTTACGIGVVVSDNDSNSESVSVIVQGIARIYTNDTITAGGAVALNAAGQAIPFTTDTAMNVLGLARDTSAATGTMIEIYVNPQFVKK